MLAPHVLSPEILSDSTGQPDPVIAVPVASLGTPPTAAEPTRGAACSDARVETIFRERRASKRPRSGNRPQPTACILWGSLACASEDFGYRQCVMIDFPHLMPRQCARIGNRRPQLWTAWILAPSHDVKPVAVRP